MRMFRVEDKFDCDEVTLYLLDRRLQTILRPDFNQDGQNFYKVTSIYFDDLYDSCLQDTVDGYRWRKKYRIRIYNDSFDVIKLEVKYKRDNRVYKKSQQISRKQMERLVGRDCVQMEGGFQKTPVSLFNLAISMQGLRAKIIVEYDRSAYVYEPGNVRITLDRNIRASDQVQDFIMGKKVSFLSEKRNPHVLEVKYDEFLPGFIAGSLEMGNLQQISYSKYRMCREISMKGEQGLCQ